MKNSYEIPEQDQFLIRKTMLVGEENKKKGHIIETCRAEPQRVEDRRREAGR